MNKYVVAHVDQFDNELTQTLIEAEAKLDAALLYLAKYQDCEFDEDAQEKVVSLDALLEACFDMDMNLSVFKIE